VGFRARALRGCLQPAVAFVAAGLAAVADGLADTVL
jgi:hypothetical protein